MVYFFSSDGPTTALRIISATSVIPLVMKYLLFTLTLVFFVGAEQSSNEMNENDLQASLASLQNTIPGLPNLMEGLPSIDEGEEVVKEKCLRNGNNESYEHAMAAKGEFQQCVRNLVNFEKIEEEMEKAKPTGDLDMVFKKYCRKTPYLRECLANFTIAVTPCLEPSEVEGKNIALNLTDSMMRFICHKEGDRIALFIAEGGPECLKAKVQYVQTCWNETFSNVEINATNPAAAMPHFVLDEDRCRKMTYVKECVVKHLEECREPTPANVIGSMFDFVKKQSPCHQYETGGSSSISSTVLCLIFPIVAYFLAKF